MATKAIEISKLKSNPYDRVSHYVNQILNSNYCIDVHVHLFDIKCINKSYFIIRMLKDIIGLKSANETFTDLSFDVAYNKINQNEENWEVELKQDLEMKNYISINSNTKGIIDTIKARNFLGFKKMEEVYNYYINNFSLSKVLGKDNVIVTALMMDLELGWDTRLNKTLYDQILELKELASNVPVLPFLVCDPRRADLITNKENLYSLFNLAFCSENPFFGIKIYPALGYDPSDFRLWPIYEICEKYQIPVLTHCGGESISTDKLKFTIFEGEKKSLIDSTNRKEVAYILNNPKRWAIVLEKFPQLKINFAHFGGYETWENPSEVNFKNQIRKECIFDFMRKYDNVYADFSYNLVEINLSKNLKEILISDEKILNRTLFGTDYWVVNKEGDLLKEQKIFLEEMDRNYKKINISNLLTCTNPKKYLFD